MDSFGGFNNTEEEWNLWSSKFSLEELDFSLPIPQIPDAWFCSLDSCVFGANYSKDENDNVIDQFPCIASADDDHMLVSGEEITGFFGEDRFLNMELVETQQGDDASNPENGLHHKRKFINGVPDDDRNKVDNPIKKIRTSNYVQKTRKATQTSNAKTNQKLSTQRRKCEYQEQENGVSDMNSCSSSSADNTSENDNIVSQDTNNNVGSKGKTSRATRGSATDPQSVYARKRRERINERLKSLQKLVPNGTKVDISTMLEEAVQYVKFLQLQIKLLSSGDMWMYAPIAYNGMDIGLQQKLSSSFL